MSVLDAPETLVYRDLNLKHWRSMLIKVFNRNKKHYLVQDHKSLLTPRKEFLILVLTFILRSMLRST